MMRSNEVTGDFFREQLMAQHEGRDLIYPSEWSWHPGLGGRTSLETRLPSYRWGTRGTCTSGSGPNYDSGNEDDEEDPLNKIVYG